MGELLATAWGAARLDGAALQRWKARRACLGAGLALLCAVSLLAGAAEAVAGTQAALSRPAASSSHQGLVDAAAGYLSRSPLPPDAQRELTANLAAWLDLQDQLAGLPRPLGQEAGSILQGLMEAFSTPYRRLALWLPYSLLVFALAKALGGRGSLAEMLGTSALYALPHLLDPLGPAIGLGPAVGLVTFGWGAAIFLKATAVANDLDAGQALVAVATPALAAVTLALAMLSAALLLR